MNRELSSILKDRIAPLPFVEVLAGLVQTTEEVINVEDGPVIKNRFPVSFDTNIGDACFTGKERELIPDSSRKSIIYFEDNGATIGRNGRNGDVDITCKVRLVAWLNRDKLTGNKYSHIAGFCIAAICGRLDIKTLNTGIFKRLTVKPTNIPPQDANLFSRYTYDQNIRQYLMPPFEVFGIDFTCTAMVNAGCIAEIDFNNPSSC